MPKKKKILRAVLTILLVLALAYGGHLVSGYVSRKPLVLAHLHAQGYTDADIANIQVTHSFIAKLASLRHWLVAVEFTDEPGTVYYYSYEKGAVTQFGAGGTAFKESLKHAE